MADIDLQAQSVDSNMSTPLPDYADKQQSKLMSTQVQTGLFNEKIGEFNKKRKVMSPILDIVSDDESMKNIVEVVYEMVVADVSKLMHVHSSKVAALEKELAEKEVSLDTMASDISNLQDEVTRLNDQLKVSIGRISRTEKEKDDIKEELLQLQARMMQDNLVFYNITEHQNEPANDCRDILKQFLKTEMKISDRNMELISFDRVHRMGKKTVNTKRPIVAKFNPVEGKRIVLDHIKNLDKSKKFGVNEQLPRQLEERKKSLMPAFKEAQKDNKKPKWQMDRLVIGGNVTKAHTDKVTDINADITEMAITMTAKHTPPKTYEGSSFCGHNVQVVHQDDIVPALHALYRDERVARAQHNIYAYRLENGHEHCEDDGEWGAGRVLLNLLREHKITNKMVCVTRWYGGRHLGKARFDHIKEAARLTLGLN